jgi:hypothetical protein
VVDDGGSATYRLLKHCLRRVSGWGRLLPVDLLIGQFVTDFEALRTRGPRHAHVCGVMPHTNGLKLRASGNPGVMTDRTSDEEDHADYTDDHQDEPRGGRPGPADEGREGGMATREVAPDVADSPDQEPPD